MALNQIFQNTLQGGTANNESNLLEDLIVESLKIYGFNVKYLPRTLVKEDDLFGEDVLSIFDDAIDIEMYIKNINGFDGEGDFLSRFGLQIKDQMTLTVARKRFLQARDESLIQHTGHVLKKEDGSTLLLEDGTGNNYNYSTLTRPNEGDLIYFPLNNKLFEIKFVEHEDVFYQLGRLYVWDLRCELYDYSSERIDTGHSDVDSIEDEFSLDILDSRLIKEDGGALLLEDGSNLLLEGTSPESNDLQANNNFFTNENKANNIIDNSELPPFGDNFW